MALSNNNCLQEIYLYNNEIDDDPIDQFVRMLSQQPDIFAIGLEFNRLGYKAVELITKAIVKHPKLEKLYLNQNDINQQAGDALAEFLSNVKNLKELRLSNN